MVAHHRMKMYLTGNNYSCLAYEFDPYAWAVYAYIIRIGREEAACRAGYAAGIAGITYIGLGKLAVVGSADSCGLGGIYVVDPGLHGGPDIGLCGGAQAADLYTLFGGRHGIGGRAGYHQAFGEGAGNFGACQLCAAKGTMVCMTLLSEARGPV